MTDKGVKMWHNASNSNNIKPSVVDKSSTTRVLVRRNFTLIEATEDAPAHYEYEECELTPAEYEMQSKIEYLEMMVEG